MRIMKIRGAVHHRRLFRFSDEHCSHVQVGLSADTACACGRQFREGGAWDRRFEEQKEQSKASGVQKGEKTLTMFDEWYVEAGGPHWTALLQYTCRRVKGMENHTVSQTADADVCSHGAGKAPLSPWQRPVAHQNKERGVGSSRSVVLQIGCGNSRLAEELYDQGRPTPALSHDTLCAHSTLCFQCSCKKTDAVESHVYRYRSWRELPCNAHCGVLCRVAWLN